MSNFATLAGVAFGVRQAVFGTTVVYSRPDPQAAVAVPATSIGVNVNTGGAYESPTGPMYGEMEVRLSDIPGGPQKNDLIVYGSASYRVQEIFLDTETGLAVLKVRKLPA